MRHAVLAFAFLAAVAPAAAAQDWPDRRDEVTAERAASASASGATRVQVEARAGSLRVEGRRGGDEVRARGTARASSRTLLEQVRLDVERRGGTIHVTVHTPDDLRNEYASLDLVVEVPADLDADVRDGSGELLVRDVGALALTDGSGSVTIENVGELELRDGSGDVRVRGVRGSATVEDGSGAVELRDVRGSVRVRDGSGALDVRAVGGDVVVERKGSGGVEVASVRGDLLVDRSVRRDVSYTDVGGRVEVPSRRASSRGSRGRWY